MKKILALAAALFASSAYAAIAGTPHDLTGKAGYTGAGLCTFCHMPHNANAAAPVGAPLWAKTIQPNSSYTFYPATIAGTPAATALGGVSAACLSCHDGTAGAVTTQHDGTLMANAYTINSANPGGTNIGKNLQQSHPVSIGYSSSASVLATAGLVTLAQAKTNGMLFFGALGDQLECGSCHDPHNQPATIGMFLRTVAGQDICAKCHNK
jgi:predicted CXXCH cytochrome family protein